MPFKEFYLTEMPHGLKGIDFELEKPLWNKKMINILKDKANPMLILDVFYLLGYKKLLQKKFLELSAHDQIELLQVLPKEFKKDMELLIIEDYELKYEAPYTAVYFGDNALRFRERVYKDINYGDPVYEMHVDIQPKDQGKGLAVKMIKEFLYKEGGVIWFSYGRITNPNMFKVIEKLKQDKSLIVTEYDNGITISE